MADSVVTPYIVMAVVLFVLGILIRKAPLPHVEAEPIEELKDGETTKTSIFQFPHLWLGVLTLFVYVGDFSLPCDVIFSNWLGYDTSKTKHSSSQMKGP